MDKPRIIHTPNAPQPAGHYSQAVAHGGLLFVSGQLPVGLNVSASFGEQARQVLLQILAILDAAGVGPAQVLKVNAYIDGTDNWPLFNGIFAELFGDARPARIVVPAGQLRHGYLIEVDAIAATPSISS
jgi:reactive intermediate/imine deaminase